MRALISTLKPGRMTCSQVCTLMMDAENPAPKRHGTLCFADGTVVICSGGAGAARMLFRVHYSVLSLHSTVFRDMFSLPPVEGVNETYDGVPLVKTTDSAEGWEDLLGILYQTKCAHIPKTSNLYPDDLL